MIVSFDPSNRKEAETMFKMLTGLVGNPTQPEPAQPEPAQPEPAQSEPKQSEPAQSEPAQSEPKQPSITLDDLQNRVRDLAARFPATISDIKTLLSEFGVERVSALKPEQYNDFYEKLNRRFINEA